MTESTHDGLLEYLDVDPQRARGHYRLLREKLIQYFDRNRCQDAADLADEVFYRTLKRLAPGVQILAADPASFVWGIARNVLREHRRRPAEAPLSDVDERRLPSTNARAIIAATFLAQCLDSLKSADRALLVLWYTDGVECLGQGLGISSNCLRLKIHRIRLKLRQFAGAGARTWQDRRC